MWVFLWARYWLWRFCSFVGQRLPLSWGYRLATVVGDLGYLLWRRGRLSAQESMTHVLGDAADKGAVAQAARESFRNYCKYLVDFLRLPLMTPQGIEERVVFNGWEHLGQALEGGRGAILVGLHFGNWDLAVAALALRRYPVNVIADAFQPPLLNNMVQHTREALGMKVIPAENVTRGVLRALRNNEILGILIDQPSPSDGVAVRFCDAITHVPAGAARLALRTGASVVTAGLVRQPDNTFLGLVDQTILFQATGNLDQDVRALTQSIMTSLERLVRCYPQQWYMFRRMWEQSPPGVES